MPDKEPIQASLTPVATPAPDKGSAHLDSGPADEDAAGTSGDEDGATIAPEEEGAAVGDGVASAPPNTEGTAGSSESLTRGRASRRTDNAAL